MKKYFSVFLLFFIVPEVFATTPLKTQISAGYTYDDNVTRAELDSDIEKDSILNVDASAAYNFPANDISFFSVRGTLEFNRYQDFNKLSNTILGLHGSYHLRPSAGYMATRYFAMFSYEKRLYQSQQRDGSATEFELGLNKRLTDLVSLRAGFIKQDINAESYVFDADNNRFYLDLAYRMDARNNLYVTLGYIDGDVVSTTVPTQKIIEASNFVIVRDDAFLDLVPDRFAYKLSAQTMSITIGDSYSLGSNQAIDGSLLYYDSAAAGGNDYSGLIINLSYLHRF